MINLRYSTFWSLFKSSTSIINCPMPSASRALTWPSDSMPIHAPYAIEQGQEDGDCPWSGYMSRRRKRDCHSLARSGHLDLATR